MDIPILRGKYTTVNDVREHWKGLFMLLERPDTLLLYADHDGREGIALLFQASAPGLLPGVSSRLLVANVDRHDMSTLGYEDASHLLRSWNFTHSPEMAKVLESVQAKACKFHGSCVRDPRKGGECWREQIRLAHVRQARRSDG